MLNRKCIYALIHVMPSINLAIMLVDFSYMKIQPKMIPTIEKIIRAEGKGMTRG